MGVDVSYSMHAVPLSERPRERMARFGAESLSLSELIAILLGSGTKSVPVLQLAQAILNHFGSLEDLAEATVEELCQVKGIGQAKAVQLRAAIHLGQRMQRQAILPKTKIDHPRQAYELLRDVVKDEKRELFLAVLLDVKGCLICHQTIAVGTLSNVQVHPREVFYPAIRHKAASMILIHNHPSGDLTPSQADYDLTKKLLEVGKLMGISVLDHLILSSKGYYSLRQDRIGSALF